MIFYITAHFVSKTPNAGDQNLKIDTQKRPLLMIDESIFEKFKPYF